MEAVCELPASMLIPLAWDYRLDNKGVVQALNTKTPLGWELRCWISELPGQAPYWVLSATHSRNDSAQDYRTTAQTYQLACEKLQMHVFELTQVELRRNREALNRIRNHSVLWDDYGGIYADGSPNIHSSNIKPGNGYFLQLTRRQASWGVMEGETNTFWDWEVRRDSVLFPLIQVINTRCTLYEAKEECESAFMKYMAHEIECLDFERQWLSDLRPPKYFQKSLDLSKFFAPAQPRLATA